MKTKRLNKKEEILSKIKERERQKALKEKKLRQKNQKLKEKFIDELAKFYKIGED